VSEKVDEYIEIYKKWQRGPLSAKVYEVLCDLRESMTQEERVQLARKIIPQRY